jgi:hypothetical protein
VDSAIGTAHSAVNLHKLPFEETYTMSGNIIIDQDPETAQPLFPVQPIVTPETVDI